MMSWSPFYSAAVALGWITLFKILSNVIVSLITFINIAGLVMSPSDLQTLSLLEFTSSQCTLIFIAIFLSPICIR